MMRDKLYYIKTWGCLMNSYDSGRIAEILENISYKETNVEAEADLVILNTCHIREKATEKVFSHIGRLRKIKTRREEIGKKLIIGVAGCIAQAEGKQILHRAPEVDLVFGPQTWHELPNMLQEVEQGFRTANTDFPVEEKFDKLPEEVIKKERVQNGLSSLAVQEGCDKFCTYCVVPFTRGAEYSRPVLQVLHEAKALAEKGAKEITLLGQNINAYHGEGPDGKDWGFDKLLYSIADIEGIERIRYTTSYPSEMTDSIINAHRDIEKLMPYVHLPVQSGSDRILKAMNRRHNVQEYLHIIEKFKKARADIAFSSDFIVGFPNETREDFLATIKLIKEVKYASAYSFIYSKRPGTVAASLEDNISLQEKSERLQELKNLTDSLQEDFNQNTMDKEFFVLFEKEGKHHNQYVARSPWMQAVAVNSANNMLGKIAKIKATKVVSNSLIGELV